jgi:spermidine synthase
LAWRRARLAPWWGPLLLVVVAIAWSLSRVAFTAESVTEHLWLLYYDLPKGAPVVHGVAVPIVITFIVTAASFVPLGQIVATRLRRFRDSGQALIGYALDLTGSLLGTIAFAIASFLDATPLVWFAIPLAASFVVLSRKRSWMLAGASAACAILAIVVWTDRADAYSPYYALTRVELPDKLGFLILANGSQHQYAAPLKRNDALTRPDSIALRGGYHLPYRFLRHRPQRILILGAGSGNDAAVAIDEGASEIDAVEIDPRIIEMGRANHPDHPYSDSRVHVFNEDARSFLNNTNRKYDFIVFGTLDSMTRLSALSNVRLDNFIYTGECFAAAQKHLAADGGIAVYFGTAVDYIDARLRTMLAQATGRPPSVIAHNFGSFNRLYLAGPAFAHLAASPASAENVPSDDWPYLYLRSRTITPFYWGIIAAIALIALIAVFAAGGRPASFDGPLFFFGLAFLLLETKSVTEMNLVWGATWLTNAVVFGAILAMILAGTLLMNVRPLPWRVSAAGLVIAMIVNFLTPVHAILAASVVAKLLLSLAFVGLPIFFASTCFALQFRDEPAADIAFGWNVIGAVAGGLIELTSMVIGLKLLSIVALASYLVAFGMRRR